MFKLLPFVLSFTLFISGGATVALLNHFYSVVHSNSQSFIIINPNPQDSSDLFLRANGSINLDSTIISGAK